MKYIKFKRGLIFRLEERCKRMRGQKKEDLEEVLKACRRAKNSIISESYFYILREHDDFANEFIEYYLKSEEEEVYVVKYRYELLEYVLMKMDYVLKRRPIEEVESIRNRVINALDNKQRQHIQLKYLRKIEYILDIDLSNYILKVGVLDRASEMKVLTDEEEHDIMYDIARRLSDKYNIGYSLTYNNKSMVIEGSRGMMELYLHKCCVYHEKVRVANLLISTNRIVDKIVKYYDGYCNKEMNYKKETRLNYEIA